MPNRNASSTITGFEYQVNVAIYFMFKCLKEISSINFEGEKLTFADFSFIPRENMRFFKYDGVTKQLTQKITTANIKTYKASDLKKKKVSFSLKAKATGSEYLHYSVKAPKNLKKYITVSDGGKVTLKKGAKKGTYKIKIKAYGQGAYKDATKTISIKVK